VGGGEAPAVGGALELQAATAPARPGRERRHIFPRRHSSSLWREERNGVACGPGVGEGPCLPNPQSGSGPPLS